MATAMAEPTLAADAMDMDIDIDLGDFDDVAVHETTYEPTADTTNGFDNAPAAQPIADGQTARQEEFEMVAHKVNMQGVDDMSTSNLAAFASENFPDHKPSIEWINDTSVNFVFEDGAIARQALAAFTHPDALETEDVSDRPTKVSTTHPTAQLVVRLATTSDKKKPRAREASRYYLLHPEEEKRNIRRPQRRRRKSDEEVETFEASMYDDDENALAKRRNVRGSRADDRRGDRDRGRSASPGRSRSASPGRRYKRDDRRDDRPRRPRNSGKELFGSSPSPLRAANNKAAAGDLKKELFPTKSIMDVRADRAADLFSTKMSVAAANGAIFGGDFPLRSDAMYAAQKTQAAQGFSIKGTAASDNAQGFSIRGAAGQKTSIKELFPDKADGRNAGKELFGGRAVRRNKAADLFG